MKLLEERIRKDGKIKGGDVLKVDSFLNHQMDVGLFQEIGKEFYRLYGDCGVTKILTIEASGIGIACVTAQFFGCPVIFAKKNKTKNIAGDVYTSKVESFTHGKIYDIIVAREFLLPTDRVLLIDDFLANGSALQGLINLVRDAGAWRRRDSLPPSMFDQMGTQSGWTALGDPWPGSSLWARTAASSSATDVF